MPMYEYRCGQCRRRFTVFFRSFSTEKEVSCTSCGSADVSKLISTFAVLKSEERRMEDMGDPSMLGDLDESDPRSMARALRKMGGQMGEDVMGPEFSEMIERMEAGESPEGMGLPISDGGMGDDEY